MAIEVRCPQGCDFQVPERLAGEAVRCPQCNSVVQLPIKLPDELTAGNREPKNVEARAKVVESTGSGLPQIKIKPDSDGTSRPAGALRRDPLEIQTLDSVISNRYLQELRDRRLLCRVIATSLLVVGMINAVPAILFWNEWTHQIQQSPLPRWIYLQIFLSGIFVVYAVFLGQIADRSALASVAVLMAVLSICFGCLSAGLVLGTTNRPLVEWLQLRHGLAGRGGIWCLAMLSLIVGVAFIAARESSHWKRTDRLLARYRIEQQRPATSTELRR